MKNYFDNKGNYINLENLSLADIYHRAFALGVESVAIKPPRGKWVEDVEPFGYDETAVAVCSVCRHSFILDEYTIDDVRLMFKYCPNCGADMREEGEP